MGGDNLALSLKDFDLLLAIEPKNTIAHNDRKKTAQLTREYEKNKRVESASGFLVSGNKSSSSSFAEIPRSTKSVSSGNGSGSGVTSSPGPGNGSGSVGEGAVMLEKSSRRLTPSSSSLPLPVSTSTSSFASSLSSNPPPPPTATSTSAAVSTNIIATPINSLSTTRKSATIPEKSVSISTLPNPIKVNKRDPVIPSEIPKTLYELERAWRGLKDRPDLFGKYLKQNMTKKSTVKKVFKEAISPELLSSVFISLRDYCSADVILTVLGGMTLLSHFSMTLALFPEEDLNCLKSIFTKILDVEDIGESKRNSALTLKEMFKM